MKLVSFSVQNYRSITKTRKIRLSNYSLLVGPNNEGKSNILHALTLAMNALVQWQRHVRRTADGKVIRTSKRFHRGPYGRMSYDWDTDYPVRKQKRPSEKSVSNIQLEFLLNDIEIKEFKTEIKSNLNGTLPLLLSFGRRSLDLVVRKPGRGGVSLTRKSTRIANFVSRRIRFEYIPAIRTAESASDVIYQLVNQELFRLRDNEDYTSALAKISELEQPVFDELGSAIQTTVARFLPSVRSVELKNITDDGYRTLRRGFDIVVNDGVQTTLERKGDGVQSLVALALMQHASQHNIPGLSTVVAIEEPESHLHPHAIHELRNVIKTLSRNSQVVLTSHAPQFLDPSNLKHTVIVRASKAASAKNMSEVREALGVRFSDNLQNAHLMLLVEGRDDVIALSAIIPEISKRLGEALKLGTVAFDYLGGASGLRQKASFYQASACMVQCFIDDDNEGRAAVKKATDDGTIKLRDFNLTSVPHLNESELEDLYDKDVYRPAFLQRYGVDPKKKPKGKSTGKWSVTMRRLFLQEGKQWDNGIKGEIKYWLAGYAVKNAPDILNNNLVDSIRAFVQTVEHKLFESKP